MERFHNTYPNLRHTPVYVDIPYKYDHMEDPSSAINDLTNYLAIITKAKELKLHIIPCSPLRSLSPF